MRRRFYAALILITAPLQAAEPDAIAAIDACTARLDAQVDIGYDRIAARCPGLARTLEQSGWAAWLPQGWKEPRNNLSAGSLMELRTVVARETATRITAHTPRVERLKEVLTGLGPTGAERRGAWSRFKRWMRDIFDQQQNPLGQGWLDRMVSRVGISDTVMEIVTYIALAAMVVLAFIVVLNELRAAGVLDRRRRRAASDAEFSGISARAHPTWRDVEAAQPMDRPGLLLGLVIRELMAKRRLPPAAAFTVRELTSAAHLSDEADRNRLAELALTAERARYAESAVPLSVLEDALRKGRELLDHLDPKREGAAR